MLLFGVNTHIVLRTEKRWAKCSSLMGFSPAGETTTTFRPRKMVYVLGKIVRHCHRPGVRITTTKTAAHDWNGFSLESRHSLSSIRCMHSSGSRCASTKTPDYFQVFYKMPQWVDEHRINKKGNRGIHYLANARLGCPCRTSIFQRRFLWIHGICAGTWLSATRWIFIGLSHFLHMPLRPGIQWC